MTDRLDHPSYFYERSRCQLLGVSNHPRVSHSFERTFTEAAEQTPRPRAGSAQAAGAANDHAQVARRTPITDESWRLRVRGADGSRATSIRAVAMPRTPETYS